MGRRGRTNLTDETYFFVTTTIVNFIQVFSIPECCDSLISNIKYYQLKYKFSILGYVIMPSHFHWIIEVDKHYGTVSDIMRDIKKYSAWDIMDILEKMNKTDYLEMFRKAAYNFPNYRRKLWMQRFDDLVIRGQRMFLGVLEYIHENPVKAGLVCSAEDYFYSSARNYKFGDHSVIYVDTDYYKAGY